VDDPGALTCEESFDFLDFLFNILFILAMRLKL
jgi:hypothetical protein